MKAATVNELKQELKSRSASELLELCSRLARFKKENKELLTYLLFEEHDVEAYTRSVQEDIQLQFSLIPPSNSLYLQKKTVRKILRTANKYVRYTGSKTVEIELALYFCHTLLQSGIEIKHSTALTNLLQTQVNKIQKLLPAFHEDLQYDYQKRLDELKSKCL